MPGDDSVGSDNGPADGAVETVKRKAGSGSHRRGKGLVNMNIGLILSGGHGSRFGSDIPKQYCEMAGKPVICHVYDAMVSSGAIDKVVIAAAAEYVEDPFLKGICPEADIIEGGNSRNNTIKRGLDYIHQQYPDCEKIISTDAVRPMITPEQVKSYIDRLDEYDAVNTSQEITDSLGCRDSHICYRNRYYLMQSPEAFRFPLLYRYFDENSKLTEVFHQMPEDATIYLDFNYPYNIKITFPHDIQIAEILLNRS